MKHSLAALCLALLTLGCVPGGVLTNSGGAGTGIATDALATETISVESLGASDDAAGAAEAVAGAALPVDAPAAGQSADAPAEVPPDTPAEAPTETSAETAPAVEPEAEPRPPASPEEAACVKKGGLWIHAGKSIAFTCVKITRDSGKQCRRGTDCQGVCLARSKTCAPYDPLFGCNEILQDDGSRVTLCID